LIDADGCPVVKNAVHVCAENAVSCLILCDTAHSIHYDSAETCVFDKGADSVDYAIANRVCEGDIVVTQDYGLASMCLARKARVIHQDGWEYTEENIDALLLFRHDSRKARIAGARIKGPRKRIHHQNKAFEECLQFMIQTSVQG